MTTLSALVSAIDEIIQDSAYNLVDRINDAVTAISAGIVMPDRSISPPLPDLYTFGTVNTSITLPYVSLPADYQRKVMLVYDATNYKISPPNGGDYYAYGLFLKQINNLSLAEAGSIYNVCVKGTKIYYQGIPSVSTTIGLHYYRKPTAMALDGDVPDGIPDHLAKRLIKHHVCKEIFGDGLEDGQDNAGTGFKYHTGKFFEAMAELVDFIPVDAEPQYYGDSDDDGGSM